MSFNGNNVNASSVSSGNNNENMRQMLFLVEILNTMYNDNLRQINSSMERIRELNRSNDQIRSILVRLLSASASSNAMNIRGNGSDETSLASGTNVVFTTTMPETLSDVISQYATTANRAPSVETVFSTTNSTAPYALYTNLLRSLLPTSMNTRNITVRLDDSLSEMERLFQPVVIHPTPQQIERAVRRVAYRDIVRPRNTTCPISLEEFHDEDLVSIIRQCGHIFHTQHLNDWFNTNTRCPVCRYDIRDYREHEQTSLNDREHTYDVY